MSMSTTSIRSFYPWKWDIVSPRLILYVISDIHLDGESSEGTLFDDRKNGPAVDALCERIAREDAELVLAGDAVDLTSMTLPKKGLERFYEKMEMRREPPERRDVG